MLPTFIVIGAMKSGTCSLFQYLRAHPEICTSRIKETDFFIRELNLHRGQAWYESLFSRAAPERGEASPNYTKSHVYSGVPERMHALIPGAKLIYILRDPVERMVSEYRHLFAHGQERRPIDEALGNREANCYLFNSRYWHQLQCFLPYYPLERICLLSAEDLRDERRIALAGVFKFLGVDFRFDSPHFDREVHKTEDKFTTGLTLGRWMNNRWLKQWRKKRNWSWLKPSPPPSELTDATRLWLIDNLRPDSERLRESTGHRFPRWCV